MNQRRRVLELFEEQKDFINERATSGIERYRKGNVRIKFVDQNGNVVLGVKVKATQKSHEFKFGANLFMLDEMETAEKNKAYKRYFADIFNMATLPFYWNTLEPERGKTRYAKESKKIYRRPAIDLCIEFCEENGIEPREHALAYEHNFPEWLRNADVEEIKTELERRYREISTRYANKIPTIEVTNEMSWLTGITKFYDEPDYVLWCFKLAEKYFPNNQLSINEFTYDAWEDRCRATSKYYAYVEANLLKGARIDAIGMQYHLFFKAEDEYGSTRRLLNPENLYKQMDLFSNLSKHLQITEVTVPSYSWEAEDEEIQADIIERLYTIWFSHPNVEQIIYWNLVDGYTYVDSTDSQDIRASQGNMTIGENYYYGGLLRFDMSPKPAYNRIKKLLTETWHTEVELEADDSGIAEFKGFYGKYALEIIINGKTVSKMIDFSKKSDDIITVVL